MSKFNGYARRVDDVVRAYAKEYRLAKAAVIDAEEQHNKAKANMGLNAETRCKEATAAAQLQLARDNFRNVKLNLVKMNDEVSAIRQELVSAIDSEYAAKSSDIDMQTMELLKSGILTERDYVDLLAHAQNHTMKRLITEKMDEWASSLGEPKSTHIRQLAIKARGDDGREYVEAFDYLADAVNRTTKNDALFDRWDDIAKQTIESF